MAKLDIFPQEIDEHGIVNVVVVFHYFLVHCHD